MHGSDIFELYRHLLGILVGSYVAVRSLNFLAWLLAETGAEARRTPSQRLDVLWRRYLLVQLLRVRPGRFAGELAQITGLVAILMGLLCLHWRW
ncbi:MAG TPA: hypothetical protein PKK06_09620 [Phycisphaerae bacterium]|nr:hypothetical protein [Phycisphaerae bacterium]HNU45558.1 hypothetical protein [Phycisphaerae bacterium]